MLGLGTAAAVVAAAAGTGTPLSVEGLKTWFRPTGADILTAPVRRGDLVITVTEKGNLESGKNEDVTCEVEGQTQILRILPEGTPVDGPESVSTLQVRPGPGLNNPWVATTRMVPSVLGFVLVLDGDTVSELDSAALRDNLTNQVIATRRAKADLENANKTLEVALINVNEYRKGIYPSDLQTAEGEIKLAESEQVRARDRLEWSDRMVKIGYVSAAQNTVDRLTRDKAQFSLKQALTKKEVLEKYTYDKTLKELEGEVEKARSDMLAKKATYTLEKDKEKKLRDMIKRCTLRAPRDGLIVYANETNSFRGNNQPLIEEGATVRERQKIFSLPDINNMQVNVKVHESMIDQVTKDLPARIRVDAAPNEPISGKVDNVAPLPDPSSFFSSDIKVYTTLVKIDKGLPALRPGMSAEVEILVKQLPNVLSVPVQAILEFKGQQHAWVIGPNGAATRRVVRVGRSNTKTIEILEGLAEGEQVALNPRGLMTEQEKQDSFGSAVQGATQGKTWTGAEAGASGAAGNAAGPDGAAGAAKGKAKGKGARGKRAGGAGGGAGGMMDPAALEKFRQLGPDEQRKQLEARGMPPEMIDPVLQRIKSGGGLGGPPGGGPGGGFGGGPQGGGPVQ